MRAIIGRDEAEDVAGRPAHGLSRVNERIAQPRGRRCDDRLMDMVHRRQRKIGSPVGSMDDDEFIGCGERIQNLRAAFNRREGLGPKDFAPHPRMLGDGDGNLDAGPLRGIRVPLPVLRDDYYRAMAWSTATGALSKTRAEQLGMAEILSGYVD